MFHKAKLGFRKWINLEQLKGEFFEAVESEAFPDRVYAYLSTALEIPVKKLEKRGWENTVVSLTKAHQETLVDKSLPLLKDAPKKDSKPVDWDYPNRTWNYYSHLLAQAYGWTLEYIAQLDVNEALAHLQEILTDDHLHKEFVYSLSEIAYPYNKSTKKSNFKPMPRPYWMKVAVKPVEKMKIRRDLLPMGMIIDASGLPPEFGIQNIVNNGNR